MIPMEGKSNKGIIQTGGTINVGSSLNIGDTINTYSDTPTSAQSVEKALPLVNELAKTTADKVKKLIAQNDADEAIRVLDIYLSNVGLPKLHTQLLLQSARLRELRDQFTGGFISFKEAAPLKVEINNALLNIAEDLQER